MKLAYLTNCFGSQSHTFIRREVEALREIGVHLRLYGVRDDTTSRAQDAIALVEETRYLYPLSPIYVLIQNAKRMALSPRHYLSGIVTTLTSPEFTFRRRLKMLYHYFAAATLVEKLKNDGITHIHAHFMNVSASIAMYAAYHSNIPFSITVHSAGTYGAPHILGVHQKVRSAQFLIMISNYNIAYFDQITPCRDKSHLVRCGMNLSAFQFDPAPKPHQKQAIQILGVGRLVEKKGFRYLIEAADLLKKRSIDFCLTIIGDGPLLNDLRALTEKLDLQSHVIFAGKKSTDEVRSAMASSDLVAVPSITSATGEMEGLPVVIMEAMATGVPVVATAHSGIPEIVKMNDTGVLVAEKSAQELAAAIVQVIQNPNQEQLYRAQQLIEHSFNISRVAQQRRELFLRYHTE